MNILLSRSMFLIFLCFVMVRTKEIETESFAEIVSMTENIRNEILKDLKFSEKINQQKKVRNLFI